ncbi:hypothetical protein J2S57_005177 [Kineosporia succinea]|uniref:Uncharacterized protein n=1 Tax=Kineosporia succinea TaxID=84632 RepID=A0ABT9P9S0_9ACTN|nr:hypothetical protein [Kineosporia succinea]MDP9829428.1 hypothetical protein [Kineosporia succinea]
MRGCVVSPDVLQEWRRYERANEAARERYDVDRDSIDARYDVVRPGKEGWYVRDVVRVA